MKKVVIVGGGLAGLTTAYYLSEKTDYKIELYEAQDALGGRVQTVEVDGFKFNYGAFMLFPWYTSFQKLLRDLKYLHHSEHLDGKHEFAWDDESNSFHEVNKHWVFDDIPMQKLIQFLPDFISHRPQLYNPDPHRFSKMTVEEYFRRLSHDDVRSLDVINKIAVGYTYGAISQLPMSIYFGFAKEVLVNSGFKNVRVLTSGAHKVIELLESELATRGVAVHTSAKVEIDDSKTLRVAGNEVTHDYLVLASAADGLLNPFISGQENSITYNDHFVAYIQTQYETKVNGMKEWNLLYTASMDDEAPQLTCIGNFQETFPEHPDKGLITYLRIPPKQRGKFSDDDARAKIAELLKTYLPDAGEVTIPFMHHWENTMPIVSPGVLERIQSVQGEDNVYFAGDYLGAPSMEVAVRSGEEVARLISRDAA